MVRRRQRIRPRLPGIDRLHRRRFIRLDLAARRGETQTLRLSRRLILEIFCEQSRQSRRRSAGGLRWNCHAYVPFRQENGRRQLRLPKDKRRRKENLRGPVYNGAAEEVLLRFVDPAFLQPAWRNPLMFRLVRPVLALACLAVFAVGLDAAAPPVKLEKGDRIVFLGDSITAAAVGPKGFVTLIKKDLAEKHKDLDVKVIGAGVSGNRVPDLQKRLEKDVLSKKPTIVVIYIGINDVWHFDMNPPRGTSTKDYEAGLRDVIKRCQDAGARVVLCTPSLIGEKKPGSNRDDAKLDAYAEISRTVAKEMKVPVCDLHKEFQAYEKAHNPENKERGILTRDGVHLTDAGDRFVADAILKALGA